ncbi:MAG: winged helix-turn-helix domain-containing protein [Chloroflexota bacterium]|nr:MAG: winged helix-turn-helix domain-containing protein [Chloroflexota bacterium]
MSSSTPDTVYPLSAVRRLALHAQSLLAPLDPSRDSALDHLYEVVKQLGCVQIDTLQMVQRSHYLVLWSRLGRYDPADFDRLVYDPQQRRLFEGWQHAACIIPLEDYRFQMPHQKRLLENGSDWYKDWQNQPGNLELMQTVLEQIRQDGGLRANAFEYNGPRRGSWWDWKPAKVALEYLWTAGDLMISNRVNFQRIYDLTERVLPTWVNIDEPSTAERDRYWVEQGARALGICGPIQAADYSQRKRNQARPVVEELISRDVLIPVRANLADGEIHTLIVHQDNLPLLQRAADGELEPRRTTFLSPFDNLFWARGRDMQLWNFHHVLEAYKPGQDRIWGYYCMPILHGDRLVGRFDPKLERKTATLRLKNLYLEPGVEPDDELVQAVAQAMVDFLAFHSATNLVIERSDPPGLAGRLMAYLG